MKARPRIFVAGAWGSMITEAVLATLVRDSRVDVVGVEFDRIGAAALRSTSPDLLLSAAHRFLFDTELLSIPRCGAVGLHPSLLPAYRGSWPLWWALRNGEAVVGLTLFRIDEGIDTGPILAQETEEVRHGDTFPGLYRRVAGHAPAMLTDLLTELVASGSIPTGQRQNSEHASQYGAPTLTQRGLERLRRSLLARRS